DRLEQLKLPGERAHLLLDPGGELHDGGGDLVDTLQVHPAQERVVLLKVAGQRLDQVGDLAAHAGFGHLREYVDVLFAVDHRFDHRPDGDAEDVGGHGGQF